MAEKKHHIVWYADIQIFSIMSKSGRVGLFSRWSISIHLSAYLLICLFAHLLTHWEPWFPSIGSEDIITGVKRNTNAHFIYIPLMDNHTEICFYVYVGHLNTIFWELCSHCISLLNDWLFEITDCEGEDRASHPVHW